jgi:hypothetical protein
MRTNAKVAMLISAAGTLAIAVPAGAHPGPDHGKGNHPAGSHKCKSHNVAYIASGTVDAATASTLAMNADGTWSGALAVDVTETNHWAKSVKGTTVTTAFTNAKLTVRFDGGTSGFAPGERVKLVGKLAVVAKGCPAPKPPASPVFRMVVVHPAKS